MSINDSKPGFTLIEVLIGMMCLPVILSLVIAILNMMNSVNVPKVRQIEVLKLQLQQSLSRSVNINYEDKKISYNYNNRLFTIELDGTRLVRRPGYEILLENVTDFIVNENDIMICDVEGCIEV